MSAPHNRKTILLLEEDPEMAALLRTSLERLDVSFRVVPAGNAQQAAQALLAERVDLLIADVASPGLSGYELLQRGRQQHPGLQAILLSALHDSKIQAQAVKAGAQAFFYKPAELADLLDAVERIFGLVHSFLPPEIQASQAAPTSKHTSLIAEGLDQLLFTLQARGVGVYNATGHLLAQAGALPTGLQSRLSSPLLAAHQAAGQLAPQALQAFRTSQQHMLLHSLEGGYAILLLAPPLNAARLAAHAEALAQTGQRLQPSLQEWQQARQQAAQAPAGWLSDAQLEAELDKAETKPMQRSETDKFWREAEQDLPLQPGRGALSYEQAALLGLTPND